MQAVTGHLAFLQDFPARPSALERLLFQVCMASLCPLGPSAMSTVPVSGAHLVTLLYSQLQSVPWCSLLQCAVPVFNFIQVPVVLHVCRDLPKQEKCSEERCSGHKLCLYPLFCYAGGRWSQAKDSVIPEAVTQVVLPGL